MPFTAQELSDAGKYSLDFYLKNNPIDQIGTERPLLKMLQGTKKPFPGAKQYIDENLRTSYGSNFQWFRGDAQVTYNKRKPLDHAQFPWSSCHDGFSLNEDQLLQNGITMVEGKVSKPTNGEVSRLADLMDDNIQVLHEGFQQKFDYELHLDGTQNADAVAGLDYLISTDGTVGTVGGIDRATNTYWQSNSATAVAAANLIDTMEQKWRACSRNGGQPDFILAGETLIDTLRAQAQTEITRFITIPEKGGTGLDPSVPALYFHGVPVMWDPVFLDLDTNLAPAIPWQKRVYFINRKFIRMRPAKGHDMITRKPPRVYDRYTYYWGLTWKGAVTMGRSNAHCLIAIA